MLVIADFPQTVLPGQISSGVGAFEIAREFYCRWFHSITQGPHLFLCFTEFLFQAAACATFPGKAECCA